MTWLKGEAVGFSIVVIILLLRLLTLNIPDLVDPTESRYAFVAQEMYLSGDWVVPKLPWQGVIQPYLGKPPLHFWLTGASFSLFGMDDWSARFSGFFSFFCIAASMLWLGMSPTFRVRLVDALLMTVSCGLLFFFAGASVVDVTLAACITVSLVASWKVLYEDDQSRLTHALVFIGVGLGFMTKGPVACVLAGLPVGLWLILTGNLRQLAKFRWVQGMALLLLITVPWFIAAEQRNPGFLRYFFVNENLGRYLLKDYGDRYGTGHRYPFGSVWGMLVLGFLPWTIPLAVELWQRRSDLIQRVFWKEHPQLLFLALWGCSPALLFTFARQLHSSYILPGIPALAFLTSFLLQEAPAPRGQLLRARLALVMAVLGVVIIAVGEFLGISLTNEIYGILPCLMLLGGALALRHRLKSTALLALTSASAYALAVFSMDLHTSDRRSSESVLRCISENTTEGVPQVGVIDANNYSVYFYSRAWQAEVGKPIQISFHSSTAPLVNLPANVLVRSSNWRDFSVDLTKRFTPVVSEGRWTWLRDSAQVGAAVKCIPKG